MRSIATTIVIAATFAGVAARAGPLSTAQSPDADLAPIYAREAPVRPIPPPPSWAPTHDDIVAVEARLRLPRKALKLKDYARYYTGEFHHGRRMLKGYFVGIFLGDDPKKGDHAGSYLKPPPFAVADGGCLVVTVYYDVAARRFAGVFCNGLA
jgi:hypothetical protein